MVSVLSEAPSHRASSWAAPAPPPGLVRRERLHAAVDRAIERPLTVVAAPAGWGKTVLLSAWAADRGAAWISVGPEHADPSGLAADLERARGHVAGGRSSAVLVDDVHLLDVHGLAAIRALVRDDRGPIVVASRSDPDLGLPRLRVEGRLGELRGADLAFTDQEVAALLHELGVELAADRRRQLLDRTDGWVAGIRLAVVALQASSDPERLLDEFSGDDRVVADYLTDEVLAVLPPDVRDFLLRTSIVDRLDVDLAAALTDRDDAAAVLDRLERQGVFVVALDRHGRCYRYHALFAELLRARLRLEQRAAVPELHERAADWFTTHGSPELAVRHALAAGSQARTRALLADHWLDLLAGGHAPPAGDIPDDDPRLAVAAAHARTGRVDLASALDRLDALGETTGWEGKLAPLLRAHAAHDIAGARRAGEAAIARSEADTGPRDEVGRALALQLLGASELAGGAAEVAADRLEEAAALAAVPGRERLRLDCLAPIAAIEVVRGRLTRAEECARVAVDLAHRHGWEGTPAAGWALAALAAVAWLRDDLAGADRRAESAAQAACTDRDALLGDALRALRAHVLAARGDEDGARTLLRLVRDAPPAPGGMLARWLEALGPTPWAPSTGDGPAEVAARAMRRLQGGDPASALRLARAVDAVAGAHPTVRLSALLVEAVARESLHEPGTAAALEQALKLAESEGLRRPFLSAGAPLRDVLRCHAGLRDASAPLLAEILDALPAVREEAGPGPSEPLSERERAVLRLMATILPNSEIAGELFVSVNTVKTHVRSIYRKLDVGSRREAVARARDVGLL
jgi:LuxR family transcriptional regulator, maltose regulon positive regulatory protein